MRQVFFTVFHFVHFPDNHFCLSDWSRASGKRGYSVGFDVGYNKSMIFGSMSTIFWKVPPAQGWEKCEVESKNATEIDFTLSMREYTASLLKKWSAGYTEHSGKIAHTRLTYPIDVTLDYLSVPLGVGINPSYQGSFFRCRKRLAW